MKHRTYVLFVIISILFLSLGCIGSSNETTTATPTATAPPTTLAPTTPAPTTPASTWSAPTLKTATIGEEISIGSHSIVISDVSDILFSNESLQYGFFVNPENNGPNFCVVVGVIAPVSDIVSGSMMLTRIGSTFLALRDLDPSKALIIDESVTEDIKKNYNLILIGGPKINLISQELSDLGLTTNEYWDSSKGDIVFLPNPFSYDNDIYIVAGSSSENTNFAAIEFCEKLQNMGASEGKILLTVDGEEYIIRPYNSSTNQTSENTPTEIRLDDLIVKVDSIKIGSEGAYFVDIVMQVYG